eukprot:TRINITY_DN50756_c0_g1_i1.p1 TRINITY_DN50756_c0_g1~~TRINITY_DN50756_c0_g1_i1.p1  ORF type:complete len:285 (+),score=54.98 TRINITY_DN50756_c0_g1_i1:71-856(+)
MGAARGVGIEAVFRSGAVPMAHLGAVSSSLIWALIVFTTAVQCAPKDQEVALLKCVVCEHAMAEAQISHLSLDSTEAKSEEMVTDLVDSLCTLAKREGRWLRRLDVVDAVGGKLGIKNMSEYGECRNECFLVRKACKSALGGQEEVLVSLLLSKAPLEKLRQKACGRACSKKKAPKPLTYTRTDEPWMQGPDRGMLEMLENRDKLRAETGQVVDVMKREDMDQMSVGDMEAQAAQEAFAEQLRDARAKSGRDWKGHETSEL